MLTPHLTTPPILIRRYTTPAPLMRTILVIIAALDSRWVVCYSALFYFRFWSRGGVDERGKVPDNTTIVHPSHLYVKIAFLLGCLFRMGILFELSCPSFLFCLSLALCFCGLQFGFPASRNCSGNYLQTGSGSLGDGKALIYDWN